ncbi:exopolysaccharide biosynthesis polyprenyl glycosylphosphotransferase [Mucilaginibacter corticis]|uniref:Exopolysaccharide biosynthesis polyprenyl glycosylphosphotransferase n=1 Tax=Mucilaginibacter corticis TaxID=2597670 RepID=A0A556MMK1_9SPHI|nr:exopolysaccharide biosynthesis polyprenyl glycosylphosphotransferase [Mucilaginibacter corticis]TSJ40989.1 exopolysaccharide biosynthesis polyprenyl glycosylphosphotransferase [Mucilaginibacter corticis]
MRTRNLISLFFFSDIVLLCSLMTFVSYLHYDLTHAIIDPIKNLLLLFCFGWFVATLIFIEDVRNLKLGLSIVFRAQLKKMVVFVSIVAVGIITAKLNDFSRSVFFGTLGLFILSKFAISTWFYYYFSIRDQTNERPTIIIGNTKIGRELFRYYSKYSFIGLKPIGILDNSTPGNATNKIIGLITDFEEIYEREQFLEVIIALPLSEMDHIKAIIGNCERNGVKSHIVPNYFGSIDRVFKINILGSIPMLDLRSLPLDGYTNRFWKRAFDILVSLALITLLLPFMALVAIAIKLESRGPVFYKPTRLGLDMKPFVLYKFRTMYHSDDPLAGNVSTAKNDTRVTPLGKLLRKCNIDELPQLLNVILNQMSLVGPRPHRVNLNHSLKQKMNTYMVRHWVKPGITGWAQVNGWRGPTDSRLQYMARTLHDVWYIEHWSFWLDMYILLLTFCSRKALRNAF